MSEQPGDRPNNDPANTQMFRAFVANNEEEVRRGWILPISLIVVFAIVLVVVLIVVT